MNAKGLIEKLGLERHPEGGWYRRTWVKENPNGGRGLASRILFLVEAGIIARWHRIDADEHYLWHAGSPLEISTTHDDEAPVSKVIIGPDAYLRFIVPEDIWQSARTLGAWSLVSATVLPEFRFEGFEMVNDGWSPRQY